jgi:hypothetical protein
MVERATEPDDGLFQEFIISPKDKKPNHTVKSVAEAVVATGGQVKLQDEATSLLVAKLPASAIESIKSQFGADFNIEPNQRLKLI